MSWITHISRSAVDGDFRINTQSLDGATMSLTLDQMPFKLRDRRSSVQITLDTSNHKVEDIARYLGLMGWNCLPAAGQTLHTFATEMGELWIPSQLLVTSLFGFITPLVKHLFTSKPLALLVRALPGSENSQIMFPVGSEFPANYGRLPNVVERLSWLTHSRSARLGWASVYRSALDGRIDCRIPKGIYEVSVSGTRVASVFCVTGITFLQVTCDDIYTRQDNTTQVFTFRKRPEQPEQIAFHRPPLREVSEETLSKVRAYLLKHMALRERGKSVGDMERTHRHLVLIKTKLSLPCAWSKLPQRGGDVANAYAWFQRLQRSNHWENVKGLLFQEDSPPKS